MRNRVHLLIHVVVPIFGGGIIYLLFRDKSLLMFQWFHCLGLNNLINKCRVIINYQNIQLPGWFVYNLPNACWVYSFTCMMIIVWGGTPYKSRFFWLGIGPIIGIVAELGQTIKVVPGTFDPVDLLLCILGSILPFLFLLNMKGSENERIWF